MKNLLRAYMITLTLFINSDDLHAQCTSTSFISGTTFSSDNTTGSIGFNNEGNAATSNDVYATAAATASLFSSNTHYLKATGFTMGIPSNAVICGIQAEVERFATNVGLFTSVEDNAVRLVKNGVITGNNKAQGTNWSGSEQTVQYGSSGDLWGTTWTPADINSGNFGIVFSATINGLVSLLPTVNIDRIRIRVHYQVVLPVVFSNMRAEEINNRAVISCTLTNTEQLEFVALERSADQINWKTIGEKREFKSNSLTQQWADSNAVEGDNYYRLKAVSITGSQWFSSVKQLNISARSAGILYNNPVSDILSVRSATDIQRVNLYNIHGNRVFQKNIHGKLRSLEIPVSFLSPGIYLLDIDNTRSMVIKK